MLTRFAPAPTGHLHLGHVVNAIHVWGLGAALGARVLLRVEDHDRERARPEYESSVLDDLDWLGFEPGDYPTATFRAGRCASRQSDRLALYESVAEQLVAEGSVYGCACSRQNLLRGRPTGNDSVLAYPGTCRAKGIAPTEGVAWRLALDAPDVHIHDVLMGPQAFLSAQAGDPVIRDRRGNWTYQFAVTVDDFDQGIDLVIRGRDLLPSTGLQIRLAHRLGRLTPPVFAHHPLVMKAPAQKLSKSDNDTGIRELRAAGWSPDRVIGEAAHLVGLLPERRPLAARNVPDLLTWSGATL